MANFATIEDIEAFLQISISTTAEIAAASRALVEATAAIRNYCNQYIERVDDEEITLDSTGGARLFLPELPVVEVASVTEDGEALASGTDWKLGQHGILHRLASGSRWLSGIQIITVVYSHGWAVIPDDIVAVATRAASRTYQAGLRALTDEGVVGVQAKSLGDFSVTYGTESVVEGTMGASAARMLLMSEKDILAAYRIRRI